MIARSKRYKNSIKDLPSAADDCADIKSKYDKFMRRVKLPGKVKPLDFNTSNLDFVNGVLSELLAQRDCFGAGTHNSESSLGVVFALSGDGEAAPL